MRRSRWDAERPKGGLEPSGRDRDGGGPGGSTGVDRSRRPAWSRGVIGGATVTVLDSGGALEPLTRPGPGPGPATPETLNNAQRTAGPVGRAGRPG